MWFLTVIPFSVCMVPKVRLSKTWVDTTDNRQWMHNGAIISVCCFKALGLEVACYCIMHTLAISVDLAGRRNAAEVNSLTILSSEISTNVYFSYLDPSSPCPTTGNVRIILEFSSSFVLDSGWVVIRRMANLISLCTFSFIINVRTHKGDNFVLVLVLGTSEAIIRPEDSLP